MMTKLLLSSEIATRPSGLKFLDAQWTIQPPMLITNKSCFVSIQDYCQETDGICYEVSVDLEYSTQNAPTEWIFLQKYFYPHSVEELVVLINQCFSRQIPSHAAPHISKTTKKITLVANLFNVRFSTKFQKIITFPTNQCVANSDICSTVSKQPSLPWLIPICVTLENDLGEPNCLIPTSAENLLVRWKQPVIFLADLSLKEHDFEWTLAETHRTCVKIKTREISSLRITMRYLATGNVVRSNGSLDRFVLGLIVQNRQFVWDPAAAPPPTTI